MPRLTPLLAAIAAALCLPNAHAADAPAPGAGTLLQQVAPPPPTTAPGRAQGVVVERAPGQSLPASAAFEIKVLQISGNTLFDSAALLALVGDAQGQSLTLAQLDRGIARITDHYRRAGYPLARAIIPAQTIQAGVVRIEVIEARLGAVQLTNRSAVQTAQVERLLAPLQRGEIIAQAALDRPLLLIGDLAGVSANAVLRAGSEVGTSDLSVIVEPGPAWTANAGLDTHGNRFTGQTRLAVGASVFNPLNRGDALSGNLLSSGKGLRNGRLAYEAPMGNAGTRGGVALSALRYELGDAAANLQAHGNATNGAIWLSHPLRRSTAGNLRAELQADRLKLRDHVDANGIRNDRQLDLLTLRLTGDAADLGGKGGQAAWSIGLIGGRLRYDDATAATADASSAQLAGSFSKLELQGLLIQPVSASGAVALSVKAQRAQGNLDASQKLSLGGPASVRAYEAGALSGDGAYLLSAEWRQSLSVSDAGNWQGVAFIDSGRATINQTPWQAGTNSASLSGAGLGLNWWGAADWRGRLSVAAPIGATPAIAGIKRSTRAWLEVRKDF